MAIDNSDAKRFESQRLTDDTFDVIGISDWMNGTEKNAAYVKSQ